MTFDRFFDKLYWMNDFIKVINATYKLLDFFPEGDPLKYKAKEKALAILENLTLVSDSSGWVSLKTIFSEDRGKAIEQLLDDIEILDMYLKLGKEQGWIGGVNFLIITKEYRKIKSNISIPKFPIPRVALGIIQGLPLDEKPRLGNISVQGEALEKPILKVLKTLKGYSERQRKILQILTSREKAQVADIIKEIPNITKRTIRRDLDDLLKGGRIIRVGEWNQVFYTISP